METEAESLDPRMRALTGTLMEGLAVRGHDAAIPHVVDSARLACCASFTFA